jgi:hypothetical protein
MYEIEVSDKIVVAAGNVCAWPAAAILSSQFTYLLKSNNQMTENQT